MWLCPNCGEPNDGAVCEICATRRPEGLLSRNEVREGMTVDVPTAGRRRPREPARVVSLNRRSAVCELEDGVHVCIPYNLIRMPAHRRSAGGRA